MNQWVKEISTSFPRPSGLDSGNGPEFLSDQRVAIQQHSAKLFVNTFLTTTTN